MRIPAWRKVFPRGFWNTPTTPGPRSGRGLACRRFLTGGDHAKVAGYRRALALGRTLARRPDLLERARLSESDAAVLRAEPRLRFGRNLYVALVHYPVVNKNGETLTTSLTNLDIHDIARVCRSYGLGGYTIVTPLADQREAGRAHRRALDARAGQDGQPGQKRRPVPGRHRGLGRGSGPGDRGSPRRGPKARRHQRQGAGRCDARDLRAWLGEGPVLLLFGTASGLSPGTYEQTFGRLRPIRFLGRIQPPLRPGGLRRDRGQDTRRFFVSRRRMLRGARDITTRNRPATHAGRPIRRIPSWT